jgi:hypothetical protein
MSLSVTDTDVVCPHTDRPRKGKSDFCASCWRKAHRHKKAMLETAVGAIAETRARLLNVAEAIDKAEEILLNAVPEAAQALRNAINVSPEKGNGVSLKASELLLTQFGLARKEGDRKKPILSLPAKQPAVEGAGVKILIGVGLPDEAKPVQTIKSQQKVLIGSVVPHTDLD